MPNRVCHVMLFKEFDEALVIIQATWPTPLEPIPVFTVQSDQECCCFSCVERCYFFSGAPIPACTPGGKKNLKYLTLLFKKPHGDIGCS